jgi:hypothetical protein
LFNRLGGLKIPAKISAPVGLQRTGAGLEAGGTAGLETCGTLLSGWPAHVVEAQCLTTILIIWSEFPLTKQAQSSIIPIDVGRS